MSRRNLARPGLSYVQANQGRVGTFTMAQEVVDARARLGREFPDLQFLWDNETEEHLVIERCPDGTERLVFATRSFYEEQIRTRLHDALTNDDPLGEIEKHNAARDKLIDEKFENHIGDMGERLAWAFAKDGLTVRPKVFIGEGIPNHAGV